MQGPERSHGSLATRSTGEATDRGVTTVIGLILTAAIIVALLINYQLNWAPIGEEERQAEAMDGAQRQMRALNGAIGTQLLGAANTTISSPMSLGVPGETFPFSASISHTIELTNASQAPAGVTLGADRLRVLEKDGRSLAGLEERYTAVPGTNGSIREVDHARLKFSAISQHHDTTTVDVTNQTGANAGWLNVTFGTAGDTDDDNLTVTVTVEDTGGSLVYADTRYHTNPPSEAWFLDLLDPVLGFDEILAAAQDPLTIEVSGSGDASYALTYDEATGSGVLPSAAGGRSHTDWNQSLPSGRIAYEANNPRYVRQTQAIENGALVLEQPDGVTFLAQPLLRATPIGDTVSVSLTVPRLTMANQSLAGQTQLTVRTTLLETSQLETLSNNLTLTFDTEHPQAWADWLDATMVDAGVDATSYSVSTGSQNATLTLTGDPSHGDREEDIHLVLHHARLETTVIR